MTHLPADLDLLLHACGLDEHHRDSNRKHYVTSAAGDDIPALRRLEADGLMVQTRSPGFLADGDVVFMATDRGGNVARAENNKRNPPPSKFKARYLHFLDVSDAWDISFGEYLKRRLYNPDVMREWLRPPDYSDRPWMRGEA